jgi:hypothetical protein
MPKPGHLGAGSGSPANARSARKRRLLMSAGHRTVLDRSQPVGPSLKAIRVSNTQCLLSEMWVCDHLPRTHLPVATARPCGYSRPPTLRRCAACRAARFTTRSGAANCARSRSARACGSRRLRSTPGWPRASCRSPSCRARPHAQRCGRSSRPRRVVFARGFVTTRAGSDEHRAAGAQCGGCVAGAVA